VLGTGATRTDPPLAPTHLPLAWGPSSKYTDHRPAIIWVVTVTRHNKKLNRVPLLSRHRPTRDQLRVGVGPRDRKPISGASSSEDPAQLEHGPQATQPEGTGPPAVAGWEPLSLFDDCSFALSTVAFLCAPTPAVRFDRNPRLSNRLPADQFATRIFVASGNEEGGAIAGCWRSSVDAVTHAFHMLPSPEQRAWPAICAKELLAQVAWLERFGGAYKGSPLWNRQCGQRFHCE
jgi:hypothetical protein